MTKETQGYGLKLKIEAVQQSFAESIKATLNAIEERILLLHEKSQLTEAGEAEVLAEVDALINSR